MEAWFLVYTHQKEIQMLPFKNIATLHMEGGMGGSAHASNKYSGASPSKPLKRSAWKEAWVLVHTHQTDMPMLQFHWNPLHGSLVHTHQKDIPMLHLQKHWHPLHGRRLGCKCANIKHTFQCSIFKNIKTISMEGGMGVSAHASNRYSGISTV